MFLQPQKIAYSIVYAYVYKLHVASLAIHVMLELLPLLPLQELLWDLISLPIEATIQSREIANQRSNWKGFIATVFSNSPPTDTVTPLTQQWSHAPIAEETWYCLLPHPSLAQDPGHENGNPMHGLLSHKNLTEWKQKYSLLIASTAFSYFCDKYCSSCI